MNISRWLRNWRPTRHPASIVVEIVPAPDEESPRTQTRVEQIETLASAIQLIMTNAVVLRDQLSGSVLDSPVKEPAQVTATHVLDLIRRLADAEYENVQQEINAQMDEEEEEDDASFD